MTNLRQAAKAVVDRWDTPAWEWRDQGPTADLMADLRKALAQPEQEPVRMPCVGKDPRCPCQDGDACHYKDCGNTKARPVHQAKPLTNEQADQIIGGLQTCHHQNSKREFLTVWLRDWAAHNIKEQL